MGNLTEALKADLWLLLKCLIKTSIIGAFFLLSLMIGQYSQLSVSSSELQSQIIKSWEYENPEKSDLVKQLNACRTKKITSADDEKLISQAKYLPTLEECTQRLNITDLMSVINKNQLSAVAWPLSILNEL